MSKSPHRSHNTSGYPGVSWSKSARKWAAYITIDGVRRYLGLFSSAAKAYAAYTQAAEPRDLAEANASVAARAKLLATVSGLYDSHGIEALSTPFLENEGLYNRLRAAGLRQEILLKELGRDEEYAAWRRTNRSYRGQTKPEWSWESAVETAKKIFDQHGEVLTGEWFRKNGYSALVTAIYKSGHTIDDLRDAVGSSGPLSFAQSRNGIRWRSRPEASLSDFLYARGIQHRRGELYPSDYAERSGRHHGRYDLHFQSITGKQIDVEIWGGMDWASGGRYTKTRAAKEAYQAGNANFLGIWYLDCQSDARLTKILEPYIGIIEPSVFDKPTDRLIQTSHWSDADECLEDCRKFAAQMPDGIFPSENWLRKRGKYSERTGDAYNTLAIRVNQWFGGTRNLRKLLGHAEASTTAWTPQSLITAWREFTLKNGLSPSQAKGTARQKLPPEIAAEGSKIYEAARRQGVVKEARAACGGTARKWTETSTLAAWQEFCREHGRTPSECMSSFQQAKLPRAVYLKAARIYNAVQRLGVSEEARASVPKVRKAQRAKTTSRWRRRARPRLQTSANQLPLPGF